MSWFIDILKTKTHEPDFWLKYKKHFDRKMEPDTKISELGFTVFDTESTGLDVKNDLLVSIAAVKVKGAKVYPGKSLELLIRQDNWRGNDSIKVHEILPADLDAGKFEMEAFKEFLDFIKDDILVAHHVAFDIGIINNALKSGIGRKLLNKSIDTAHLAGRLEKGVKYSEFDYDSQLSLDNLCEKFNIEIEDRHTAAGDAYATALLFLKLLLKLEQKGIKKFADLKAK